MLSLLAAAPKGPLDTWSPTLLALFALLLPLIGLLIILAFTVDARRVSAVISIVFTLAAAVCALLVVSIEVLHPLHAEQNSTFLQFFTGQAGAAQQFVLQWGVLADPLAAVLLIAVMVTSLLVQVYALAYIRREDGPVRFFALILTATFAMTGVVLSTSYFEMLFFFGLVTLSTYLMVNYWWQREDAGRAALTAFVISLAGDLALLAGMAYIYFRFSELNFQALATQYTGHKAGANGLFALAIVLLIAAAAKSAQFPLHLWLPASAQAPAPGVALLQSAGAALCGVYLIARSYAVFHASPRGLALLTIVGGATALVGVGLAIFQQNLKRAIAYTTMSELGLMVLALGIGAYGASVFEAFARAWPTALLFLAAGVVIREMRSEQLGDMGGLWQRLPYTRWLMLIAVAAGAGIPPLSTFWSKDAILSKALAINSPLAIAVIVAVTFLGAIALVRVFSLTFLGETARRRRFEPERIRDAGGRIALAMATLAIPCLVSGIRGIRGRTDPIAFVRFPGVSISNSHLAAATVIAITAIAGAAVAWLIYGRRLRPVAGLEPLGRALATGLYLEPASRLAAGWILVPVGRAATWLETHVVDAGIDLASDSVAYAVGPKRRLPDLRASQLLLAVIAGVAVVAAGMVLAGRILGRSG
jgi:NADH-quinone oxidoreductase subunit L